MSKCSVYSSILFWGEGAGARKLGGWETELKLEGQDLFTQKTVQTVRL